MNWALFAIGFVAAVLFWLALCYAFCRAAGEADDDADRYEDEMRSRGMWSHK